VTSSFLNGKSLVMTFSLEYLSNSISKVTFSLGTLSDGEIWTAHGGVNPCGLVVRRGGI
jgi:hypothetical protein